MPPIVAFCGGFAILEGAIHASGLITVRGCLDRAFFQGCRSNSLISGRQLKNLPYFRWFPADAGMDETYAAMTYEERGFYHSLLNFSWINAGLPLDLEQLRRVMQVPAHDFDRLWTKVFTRFLERDGRLVDPRQEEEREWALSKSKKATDAVRTRYVRRSSVPTNVLPRAYGCGSNSEEIRKVSISDFPKTEAAVCGHFPSTDMVFVLKIVQMAAQMYLSVQNPKIPEPTDETYAAAVEQAFSEAGKQTSAGLFLRTVPATIVNWAKSGRANGQKSLYREYDPDAI